MNGAGHPPHNSLVIPVYRNEENLPDLLSALRSMHAELRGDLEVVFVVDGSPDRCWQILSERLGEELYTSQLLLHSRNFGSFAAIRKGLEVARGRHLAVMAADLQEPPELVAQFFTRLGADECDVVVGRRTRRVDSLLTRTASGVFWWLYRRWVMPEMPEGGVDVFGCSAKIRDDLLMMDEVNTSLVSQLLWVGGRRTEIPYERRERTKGRSAWTLARKLRYMLDSVMAFSDLPIFLLLWVGTAGILFSLVVSATVFIAWAIGVITVDGYTPVMLLVALMSSLMLFGQGIIGSYVWRASENTKARPTSLVRLHRTYHPSRAVHTEHAPAPRSTQAEPESLPT